MSHALSKTHVRHGFTIIELMIVIAIGAGIIAAAGVLIQRVMSRQKFSSTTAALQATKTAIFQFNLATSKWPSKLSELVTRPSDQKIAAKWQGPYLEEEPEDGWGNPLRYEPTPGKPQPYALYSFGPNGPGASQDEWIYA